MKKIMAAVNGCAAIVLAALVLGHSFGLFAQSSAVQTSGTLKASCMSDGTMRMQMEPKP